MAREFNISKDIEILDWRRLDLDPASLAKVGKSLRQVHLQWSGRNTTLRAWSEKEGLAKIPTLEDIYITQVEVPSNPPCARPAPDGRTYKVYC